jgi:prevent-host-death family protein
MQTLTSAKVQANFGQAIDIAKAGETLTITQYGRPTAMLFSFKEGSELIRLRDMARLNGYFTARQDSVPQDAPELSMDDINKLVHELRP